MIISEIRQISNKIQFRPASVDSSFYHILVNLIKKYYLRTKIFNHKNALVNPKIADLKQETSLSILATCINNGTKRIHLNLMSEHVLQD